MTRTTAIREAIVATLLRIDGTAPYVNDLTVSGSQPARVVSGKYAKPPIQLSPTTDEAPGRPFLCVHAASIDDAGGPDMSQFTQTGVWIIRGWAAAGPKAPAAKLAAAEALLDDVKRALRSNLSLCHASTGLSGFGTRNLVDRLVVRAVPFDEGDGQPQTYDGQHGMVLAAVTCWWREDLPAQVSAP